MFRSFFSIALLLSVFSVLGAEDHPTFKVGAYTFKRPEGWNWVESSGGMRAAQLKIAGEKGPGEVVFFVFPAGAGGDAQANVDRWLAMFQEGRDKINSKVEKTKAGGAAITYVQAEGTYMSGMPGGAKTPMPNSMLQGAIIESEQGNVFIRLTGPNSLVKSNQEKFKKMVSEALGK
jgi:hypothetical protein